MRRSWLVLSMFVMLCSGFAQGKIVCLTEGSAVVTAWANDGTVFYLVARPFQPSTVAGLTAETQDKSMAYIMMIDGVAHHASKTRFTVKVVGADAHIEGIAPGRHPGETLAQHTWRGYQIDHFTKISSGVVWVFVTMQFDEILLRQWSKEDRRIVLQTHSPLEYKWEKLTPRRILEAAGLRDSADTESTPTIPRLQR